MYKLLTGTYAALAVSGGLFAAALDSLVVLGLVVVTITYLMYTDGMFSNE
jgi:hypothetical protein